MNQCLVIDNSSVVRKVAKYVLNSIGFEVIEAADGQEGLDKCQLRMPEMVIVDRDLPLMRGQDFLTMLTHAAKAKKPFIIYTTIENDPLDIARAVKMGADAYMLKPYTRADLLNAFGKRTAAA